MKHLLLTLVVIAGCAAYAFAGSECGLGGVVINVKHSNSTFLGIPATLTGLRRNASENLHLSVSNPFDACESITNDISDCMFMSLEDTELDPDNQLMLVSIPRQAGTELRQAAAEGALVSVWLPDYSTFDFNVVLLWIVAVGTFALAGICAANDCKTADEPTLDDEGSNTDGFQLDIQEITAAGAMAFVAVASASLLILYFFLNNAFYWMLMIMFSIGACQALAACISPACRLCCPRQPLQLPTLPVSWLPQSIAVHALLSNGVALATVAVWLGFRDWAWAWLLQDLLGICLIVLVLRQFRLPNLKVMLFLSLLKALDFRQERLLDVMLGTAGRITCIVARIARSLFAVVACILLPLCFVYDVFWVFLQPLLTNGDSVMVKVATGGDEHWSLPMLIIIPAFRATPGVGPVILGFGDILLPGLLGVYARSFDVISKRAARQSYFWPCVSGYAVGLLLTYGALYWKIGGDQGQPALLYLVPCTLGVVLMLAQIRKDLPCMWTSAALDWHCEHTFDCGDVEANVVNREAQAPLL